MDIDISEMTVFMNLLDGVREFVEGRIHNYQVSVG